MESHGLESMETFSMDNLDYQLVLFMGLKGFMLIISLLVHHMQTIPSELDISFIIQHARMKQVMGSVHNVLVDMDSIQQQDHAHHAPTTNGVMEQQHVNHAQVELVGVDV